MAGRRGQPWRQLTVWLHVVTSVGWMGQALAIASLQTMGLMTDDPSVRLSATSMAEHLDMSLLVPLANTSAFTGFMLAAATPWGFFRYWWVLAKFAITLVQLYVGIFILSDALRESVTAARSGSPGPTVPLAVGAALMASAIAFQAWLSIAKPWARTPWASGDARGRGAKLPTAPNWMFTTAVLAPLVDIAVGTVLGNPTPMVMLLALGMRLVIRRRELRAVRAGNRRTATHRN